MKVIFQIQPLDPVMIRDGRPFDDASGAEAHSMNDITPGVLAGSLRSMLGKYMSSSSSNQAVFESPETLQLVKSPVRGPLYQLGNTTYYPLLHDMDVYHAAESVKISVRRPGVPAAGQGFLGTGRYGEHGDALWPVQVPHRAKPCRRVPALVPEEWMTRWLCGGQAQSAAAEELSEWCSRSVSLPIQRDLPGHEAFIAPFDKESRNHTTIRVDGSAAGTRESFATEALVLPPEMTLCADIDLPEGVRSGSPGLAAVHTLGGRRGLAYFREVEESGPWNCPEAVLKSVGGNPQYLRMVLATPAYFSKGWLPGWLNEQLESGDAFDAEVRLKLRWACIPRWQPVSGWSYRWNQPKSVRRMVPAGSVYFFEVIRGEPQQLVQEKWLISVSDKNRRKGAFDKEDGYGLALWGTWSPQQL